MDDSPRLSLDKLESSSGDPGNERGKGRRAVQRKGRTYWTRSRKEALAAWLFVLPDFVGLLIFVAAPMALSLSLGFFSVDGFGGYKFIGLANYNRMFHDPLFLKSIGVTIVYVVFLVPGLYVSGLGLALLVRQKIPWVGVWRSLFFMPYVISLVVIALIWKVMLIDKVGFVNQMLELFGLQGRSWLGDPNFALGAVLVVTIWFLMGYYMIIFLSGLQEIPREYYEAARIDGAKLVGNVHEDYVAFAASDQLLRYPGFHRGGGLRLLGLRPHLCNDQWWTGKFDLARGLLYLRAGL